MTTKLSCPKCPAAKLDTLTIKVHDRSVAGRRGATADLSVDRCPACGGIWFDPGELDKYLDAKFHGLNSPELPAQSRGRVDAMPAQCPRCLIETRKGSAPNNPAVTADYCPRCGGLWLDGGELAQVEKAGGTLEDQLRSVFGDLKA